MFAVSDMLPTGAGEPTGPADCMRLGAGPVSHGKFTGRSSFVNRRGCLRGVRQKSLFQKNLGTAANKKEAGVEPG